MNKSQLQAGPCISHPSFSHFMLAFKARLAKTHKTTVPLVMISGGPMESIRKMFPFNRLFGKGKINNF